MLQDSSQKRRSRRIATLAAAAASALLLAGCAGGAGGEVNSEYGFATAEQEAGSPIMVWVDAAREPAIAAFQEANPDIPLEYEVYDGNAGGSGTFQTRIALMDQAGEGWPDVVFSTQQNDASWASQPAPGGGQGFAAPLNKGFFDQEFLDGFATGALDPSTIDDTVYGLRNDLAQVVTYYNQPLLDQFGYDVPTTWEEYGALGDKLAAEHPGYILGSVGDAFMPYVYYQGTQSPVFQTEGDTFVADMEASNSVEITKILDKMIANGTIVQDSVFSAEFTSKYADKVVVMPGPVWYTGAVFQSTLQVPEGQLGVAAPLAWEGEEIATGNVGGGIWYASSHTKNLEAVKTFLEFAVSAPEFQVELSSGYPAYSSAAEGWLGKLADTGYFIDGFEQQMIDAGGSIWSGWASARFSPETAWATTVMPAIAEGKTIESVLPSWQTEVLNEAQVNGYTAAE
ncbi:MAG: ABC transporter substrate-binding protein [Pseudoclavibacter sp.]